MTRRWPLGLLCMCCLVFSLPRMARGQSYDAALLDGVSARDRAVETGDASDWQRAAQHFARARELRSSKEAEFEFAEAALRLDRWLEAYAAYEAALELGLQGKAAERAREFLAARAPVVARLVLDGPPGTRVFVDGRAAVYLPLRRSLVVEAGTVELRAEQPGFRAWQRRVSVTAQSSTRIQIELEPLPVSTSSLPAQSSEPSPALLAEPPAWAAPLTISGASLFVLGGVGVLTTSLLLPGERRELQRSCAEFDGDECAAAAAERREHAQSVANRIETLENLRWTSLAGASLGLLGAAVGLVPLLSDNGTETARQASLRASPDAVWLEWRGRF